MKSRITADRASMLVKQSEQDYIDICTKIENAALNGEREIEVKEIVSYDTRLQLEKDGFELTANKSGQGIEYINSNTHRIWWK